SSWFRALVFVPVLVWLGVRHRWATFLWVAVATVLVSPLNEGLKQLVDRSRPDYAEGGAQLASLSFPSGHSAGIACLVTTALVLAWPRLRARRWWVLLGVLVVVLVGLSRVWLGVHHPTDVLAGWAVGVGWTLSVALLLGGLPGGRAALPAREGSWTA
ncbi:MAG: phosphoesterase PA-phosphatase related protein, partial [Klenkia sp.]|nr:phosphoesterase PA-phosphatase related protein [Klenkia sp.]